MSLKNDDVKDTILAIVGVTVVTTLMMLAVIKTGLLDPVADTGQHIQAIPEPHINPHLNEHAMECINRGCKSDDVYCGSRGCIGDNGLIREQYQ